MTVSSDYIKAVWVGNASVIVASCWSKDLYNHSVFVRQDFSLNNRVRSCISLRYSKGRSFGDVSLSASLSSKISDCQPEGLGFNSRPGRGLNFGRPSLATPSVDRDVKPLV